ncbi:hypothetical protein ACF09J_34750 [Streptomyces sp. NPDC014889]|uniref:hypothetical protein n=1 Tax=Streptomyces sp. NPDC014889 TaxID=3364928 RepID=UPI0036FAB7BE
MYTWESIHHGFSIATNVPVYFCNGGQGHAVDVDNDVVLAARQGPQVGAVARTPHRPLQGVYDPSGHGAALFAFFARTAESEREYIREKVLEDQASARERGRHGGRPKVVDDDMADYARSLRGNGVPVPQIAQKLIITSGKNKGQRPSVATVYRILAEDTE